MKRFPAAFLLILSFASVIRAQTQSFWTTATAPAHTSGNDDASVELGLRFSSNIAGTVTGARIYCATNSSGTHTVHLWNSRGSSLATATLPACKGWTVVNFASAVAITAGSTYTISYHTTEYPWNTQYFTAARASANLTAPANAGVYAYGRSPAYPSSTWQAANYWVDVLFTPGSATPTYTISGTVGVGGVKVTLTGAISSASVTSGSGGVYSFTGLAAGSYTVTPSAAGYAFNPPSQTVSVTNANLSVNFAASLLPPSITGLSPRSGSAGSLVTVMGANFGSVQGNSTVSFNAVAAVVTNWSASQITATVPAGATTGNVVVIVGGLPSNGVNFTVQPAQTSLPSRAQVIAAIKTVNDYWIAHNTPGNSDWDQATYFAGDLAAYDAAGQANYLTYAQTWATKNGYSLVGGNTTTWPDYQAAGQPYVRLYQLSNNSSDLTGITQSISGMVNSTVDNEWTWVDAINMSMPDFAELGSIYNDTNYYTKMYALYSYPKYSLKLYDATTGLWWRDSSYVNTTTYWSRGNGWAFAVHATVLSTLPKSDPHYAEYLSTFTTMAQALAARQQPGGYWNSGLGATDPNPGPESSGTALFLYGLAWGLNNGILDQNTYLPVVEKAWNYFTSTAIQPSGLLGYVQNSPTCNCPGPTSATSTYNYGVGAFLLAARQIALLTQ